jgi:hypothetical protein
MKPWETRAVVCISHKRLCILHKGVCEMHTADPAGAATEWVRAYIAAERAVTGSVKSGCAAAARFFGISPRRAASYWWKQVSTVPAEEFLRLQAAHRSRLRLERMRAARAIADLDALLAEIEEKMPDAAVDGPDLAPMAHLARTPDRTPPAASADLDPTQDRG